MKRNVLMAIGVLLLSGCASDSYDPDAWKKSDYFHDDPKLSADERATAQRYQASDPDFYKRAYEQGVRDTMNEYKDRMRARGDYVFEPTVMQRVLIPARVIGNTFYPEHEESVIVKQGRWVQENNVPAPVAPSQASPESSER